MAKTAKKETPRRDLHLYLPEDDYRTLVAKAEKEARSVTSQALVYVRRGIAQDAKK